VLLCVSGFALVLVVSVALHPVFGEGLTVRETLLRATPIGVAVVIGLYFGTLPRASKKE
jgi:hypothetical protein